MTKFSIIVPVYNVVSYLEEAIMSVMNQDYGNFELILVDDGSTDGSDKICDDYSTGGNVRCLHTTNCGVSRARNKGLDVCTGDWVLFLDSDDWLDRHTLSRVASATTLGVDIVQFGFTKISKKEYWDRIPQGRGLYNNILDYHNSFSYIPGIAGYAIKKEIIDRFDLRFSQGIRYSEDHEFILKCFITASSFFVIHNSFYYYRDRDGSAVNQPKQYSTALGCLKVIRNVSRYVAEHSLPQSSFLSYWIEYSYREYYSIIALLPFSWGIYRTYYKDFIQYLSIIDNNQPPLFLFYLIRIEIAKLKQLLLKLYLNNKLVYKIVRSFR